MGNGNDAEPLSAGFSVLRRTRRDIILATFWMGQAQRQISRRGDHILPQILNLLSMQNGRGFPKGWQLQESKGIPSSRTG